MTSVDELTRIDQEIRTAEQRALRNLAGHLREAVLDLPSESKLARSFAKHSTNVEGYASAPARIEMGCHELDDLERDRRADAFDGLPAILWEYAGRVPTSDPYGRFLRQIADQVDGMG